MGIPARRTTEDGASRRTHFSYDEKEPCDEDESNLVLIVRQDGNKLYFWCLAPGADVAKGRLKEHSGDGMFKSDDVKAFLAEYADAYVLANEPLFVFTKR